METGILQQAVFSVGVSNGEQSGIDDVSLEISALPLSNEICLCSAVHIPNARSLFLMYSLQQNCRAVGLEGTSQGCLLQPAAQNRLLMAVSSWDATSAASLDSLFQSMVTLTGKKVFGLVLFSEV